MPGGRPSDLDRVVHVRPNGQEVTAAQSVLERITLGLEWQEAATTVGVAKGTVNNWRLAGARARRKQVEGKRLTAQEQRYAEFLTDLERAQHQAHLERLAVIQRATQPFTVTKVVERVAVDKDGVERVVERTTTTETKPGQWTAAAWWLERRMPAKYGKRIELSGQVLGGSASPQERASDLASAARAYLDAEEAEAAAAPSREQTK